jgi:hypothetical protein
MPMRPDSVAFLSITFPSPSAVHLEGVLAGRRYDRREIVVSIRHRRVLPNSALYCAPSL